MRDEGKMQGWMEGGANGSVCCVCVCGGVSSSKGMATDDEEGREQWRQRAGREVETKGWKRGLKEG